MILMCLVVIRHSDKVQQLDTLPTIQAADNQGLSSKVYSTTEPMALSLTYWEQTANALKNLMDLQCWAKSVNISKVLEPSIRELSQCVFRFRTDYEKRLKFGDMFNKDSWNDLCQEKGYAQLVSQEYFLKCATREVVVVQFYHCVPLESLAKQPWYKYLAENGFFINRTVCINFHGKFMKEEVFRGKIFEDGNIHLL